MQALIDDFLKQKSFAVIGSFRNESKYAYQILMALKNKGYDVYPVNPRLKEVSGMPCYHSVGDIPGSIDVADIVTPPVITEKIVQECRAKGIKRIWMQPGAESESAIRFCEENGMRVVYNACIMLKAL